jgi:hypothetical protein
VKNSSQACKDQVEALRALKGAKPASGGGDKRRMVVVLNVGATTALATSAAVTSCLTEQLPAALASLSLRWPRSQAHKVQLLRVILKPLKVAKSIFWWGGGLIVNAEYRRGTINIFGR